MSEKNPRNQIFSPSDFKEGFLEKLQQDHQSLEELCEAWAKVEQDPKWQVFLQLLKTELIRKDLNPSGKLVIFTESKETAKYLTRQFETEGYGKVLSVSSENRKSLQDTIQDNFDANIKEWKNDFDFIISTKVLAEGINLHRANVIVNYDTPWNATKLMQRIGRINRIGSSADMIYNYAIYPSRQSDDLVSLYNNAYIKLQGFHTAYGEDAQIYTIEEVLEKVKLHIKGLPEDEDKRLKYLEFIRNFKVENEKEFKRIKGLPLKARTARNTAKSEKKIMAGGSLIFLKSSYKMEFYKVAADNVAEALNFVEAAESFEAKNNELSIALPEYHHEQVQRAVNKFEQDLLLNAMDSISGEHTDANTNRAKKFLRDLRADSSDEKFRQACNNLLDLLEKGVITNLANELRKLRLKYDKNEIKLHQVENIVLQLAVKYAHSGEDNNIEALPSDLPIEITDKPDIIITETFSL